MSFGRLGVFGTGPSPQDAAFLSNAAKAQIGDHLESLLTDLGLPVVNVHDEHLDPPFLLPLGFTLHELDRLEDRALHLENEFAGITRLEDVVDTVTILLLRSVPNAEEPRRPFRPALPEPPDPRASRAANPFSGLFFRLHGSGYVRESRTPFLWGSCRVPGVSTGDDDALLQTSATSFRQLQAASFRLPCQGLGIIIRLTVFRLTLRAMCCMLRGDVRPLPRRAPRQGIRSPRAF